MSFAFRKLVDQLESPAYDSQFIIVMCLIPPIFGLSIERETRNLRKERGRCIGGFDEFGPSLR